MSGITYTALADKESLDALARQYRNDAIAAESAAYLTGEKLKDYTRPNGKLRGFEIFGWKTAKRAMGEQLTTQKAIYEQRQAVELSNMKDAEYSSLVAEKRAVEAEQSAEAHQRDLDAMVKAFGDNATLERADKVLNNSIEEALSRVTPEQVYDEFLHGRIEASEARRSFELKGEHAYIDILDQHLRVIEEEAEELEPANDNEMEL
jgi:hypothetical protein